VVGVAKEEGGGVGEGVEGGVGGPTPEIIAREYAHRLRDYGAKLIAYKRRNLTEDILSTIITAHLDPDENDGAGGSLTDGELLNFFMLLFSAGAETTRSAIAGGLCALMQHPEQVERLRGADIGEMRTAIDEILRWTTPSIHKRRTATRDVSYKAHRIQAGAKGPHWEMSANRDAAVFDGPFRFY